MSLTARTNDVDDVIIAAPRLLPFTKLSKLSCNICGVREIGWFARFYFWLCGHGASIYAVSYCAGGRAPVEEISSPIEAMMRGSSETRPNCGGITEPHLHLKCRCCDYVRFMRTKDRAL